MSLQYWGRNFAGQSAQYAATPVTFASLPPASSVEGQVRVLSDVNYIEVVSRGGVWRPRGGRQVLALRHNNPVTRQDTAEGLIETIGPFPGGLVRANMRLEFNSVFFMGALGTGTRKVIPRIGTPASIIHGLGYIQSSSSGIDINGELRSFLAVLSDVSAPHKAAPSSGAGGASGLASGYITGNAQNIATVDFSQPWSIGVSGASANETAVNITGASWAAGEATYNATAHTLAVGDKTTVAGIAPSGYNQVGIVTAVPNANSFKMALASDPGAYTSGGTSSRISNVISQSYTLTLEG